MDHLVLDAGHEELLEQQRAAASALAAAVPGLAPAQLARAAKRFSSLDVDGSGSLEGDELVSMAQWVGAMPLAIQTQRLLGSIHSSHTQLTECYPVGLAGSNVRSSYFNRCLLLCRS